jgi:RHS repeat-associated protein
MLDSGMGGIMDYKARFYSPALSRFIQPDSIIPNPVNPQAYNRFSYVFGNPINLNDPSGNIPIDCYGTNYCGSTKSNLLPEPYKPPKTGGGGNGGNLEEEFQEEDEFFDWDGSRGCYDLNNNRHGCARYYSIAIGLDAPTIMVLLGLGLGIAKLPHIGLPVALAGLLFEKCAFTASPVCAAVKLTSLNISATIDSYGNLYIGPQISIGKSILPVVAFSNNIGAIYSHDQEPPTEAEVRDHLTGFSVSGGTIATGGINYSPFATTYNTSYYTVGLPEVISANFNLYNFRVYDFIP